VSHRRSSSALPRLEQVADNSVFVAMASRIVLMAAVQAIEVELV
jgi:hypothetical protein